MSALPSASRAQRASRSARASAPVLTGGEKPQQRAKVDWLSVTWRPEPGELVDRNVIEWLLPLLGVAGAETVGAFHQYENAIRFWSPYDGTYINLGRLDWGGEARDGKARLELTGHGCTKVLDWELLHANLQDLSEVAITRVDLAVDCLEGEYSVDDAVEWWRSGEFQAPGSGRRAKASTIGDWLSDDNRAGRTLEVGRRANGKMCRVYEKGRQLGDGDSPWVRFEVELRNNDRDIPLDVLIEPDPYFVGAYRCFEKLLPVAGERIATHRKEGELTLATMTDYARTGYGQVLHVLRATGLSFEAVYQEIARAGIPKRLERAALGGFIQGPPPGPLH